MTADKVVYRTTVPAVVAMRSAWDESYKAWVDHAFSLVEELFPGEDRSPVTSRGWRGEINFVGISHATGAAPDGWKIHAGRGTWFIWPKRNTKVGRELARKLSVEPFETLSGLPGMPARCVAEDDELGPRFLRPGLKWTDDALFAVWGAEPSGVDDSIWERIKLSEFYAAMEAKEAAA